MNLTTLQNLMNGLAQVALARLPFDAETTALTSAVERYSVDRPKSVWVALTLTDGGAALPEAFIADFSTLQAVEYPVGNRPPTLLTTEEFYVTSDALPYRVELLVGSATDAIRVQFSIKHVATADAYTIPAQHTEAVAAWAAAVLCEMEASRLSNNATPTIQADVTDQANPARAFATRAKTLRQRYFDELGIDPKRNGAAGVDIAFARRDSTGRPLLTHPLRGVNRGH